MVYCRYGMLRRGEDGGSGEGEVRALAGGGVRGGRSREQGWVGGGEGEGGCGGGRDTRPSSSSSSTPQVSPASGHQPTGYYSM